MKIFNILILFVLVASPVFSAPSERKINLKEITKLVAYIPPGQGIRITLPFFINEQDEYAPFSQVITNPAFKYIRPKVGNSFNVWLPHNAPDTAIGNLFFNIAGYEVSVELRGTKNRKKHISNYLFVLSNEKRETLIQKAIQQRSAALEQEYQERFNNIDKTAELKALAMVGELALKGPKTKNVKEENKITLNSGDELVAYVDEMRKYDKYMVIPFELELKSYSDGAALRGIKLFSKDINTGKLKLIKTSSNYPKRLEPGIPYTGVITSLSKDIDPKSNLSLQIVVEGETLEVVW